MNNQACTDFDLFPANKGLTVVQPLTLSRNPDLNTPDELFSNRDEILADALQLRFVHLASLRFAHDEKCRPTFLADHSCGGTLKFRDQNNGLVIRHLKEFDTVITCSGSNCGLQMGLNLSLNDISDSIFQLLLKQVFPDLPVANCWDCSLTDFRHLTASAVEEIKKFGLMAIISEFAYSCSVAKEEQDRVSQKYNLALTLGNGLLTFKNLDNCGAWSRYLISKEWERKKNLLHKQTRYLLGPKPR